MLQVESVSKTFPRPPLLHRLLVRGASDAAVEVLRQVDLTVARGEVVGLVGPNGAGKSTLIRIIATVLDLTSGRVTVDGHDVRQQPLEVRRRLGLVLSDERSMYWRLNGRQNLEFFGRMSGLDRRESLRRTDALLERFDLAHRDRMVYAYSSGMRARLAIARAIIHDPPLLVLDEPTRSLDPVATRDVGEIIRDLAARQVAVLLSSHRLDEIEKVCDRIVVLTSGSVRYSGTIDDVTSAAAFDDALHRLLTDDTADGPAGRAEG
jgi:ABC-type multidrug transport system ATPase subunit